MVTGMTAEYGPLHLSAAVWRHDDTAVALRDRDVGALLRIVQRHTGASQTRIAAAVGLSQGRANEILRGRRRVDSLAVLERVADGLSMPDAARMLLGLAPQIAATATTVDDLSGAAGVIARSYPSQSHAAQAIRERLTASHAVDVLVVRGLGLIALNDSLLRGPLTARRTRPLALRVLMLAPESSAAAARAGEVGETPESFSAGIRLAEQRLRELVGHPALEVSLYHYDRVPTWRVVATDSSVFIGTFDAGWEGHASPMYRLDVTSGAALYRGARRMIGEMMSTAVRVI